MTSFFYYVLLTWSDYNNDNKTSTSIQMRTEYLIPKIRTEALHFRNGPYRALYLEPIKNRACLVLSVCGPK